MKFFIDTANVNEIRAANDMGVIAGVTTNPSLIAKEGRDHAETLAEIATIVDGPISGEVKATTTDAETMVKEGEAIYALDPKHMVVKIPMTAEGLKAIKALSAKGIPTNCTLIFSANQALLAARAGATYVSPFLGRLDDISQRGIELIETIHDMFLNYPDIETQIIAASVRNPIHVTDCALAQAAGGHIHTGHRVHIGVALQIAVNVAQGGQVLHREKSPVGQRAVQPRRGMSLGEHEPVPVLPFRVGWVDAHFLIIKVSKHIGGGQAAAGVPGFGTVGGFNHAHTHLAGCDLQLQTFFLCHITHQTPCSSLP